MRSEGRASCKSVVTNNYGYGYGYVFAECVCGKLSWDFLFIEG